MMRSMVADSHNIPSYNNHFIDAINTLQREGRYRVFLPLQRQRGRFPHATTQQNNDVMVWCSNDYLGLGQHPQVIAAMQDSLAQSGAGAGGTRNISGTSLVHTQLEQQLAQWHGKDAALVFSSGYVANDATLSTMARLLPNCHFFSDADNHASMIEGIRRSRAPRHIFAHNNMQALEQALQNAPADACKVIVCESLYSMGGDMAPLDQLVEIAQRYGAMTFVDEVHAVGLYGHTGAGVAQLQNVAAQVSVVSGTLGKAFGVFGGYVAGSHAFIDAMRSFASGFIFTTSIPPVLAAGALASLQILNSAEGTALRAQQQERVQKMRGLMQQANIDVLPTTTHILPVMVRDAVRCKQIADILLQKFGHYAQPINYPTVPRGTERLRFTPSPLHDDAAMHDVVAALQYAFAHTTAAPKTHPVLAEPITA